MTMATAGVGKAIPGWAMRIIPGASWATVAGDIGRTAAGAGTRIRVPMVLAALADSRAIGLAEGLEVRQSGTAPTRAFMGALVRRSVALPVAARILAPVTQVGLVVVTPADSVAGMLAVPAADTAVAVIAEWASAD